MEKAKLIEIPVGFNHIRNEENTFLLTLTIHYLDRKILKIFLSENISCDIFFMFTSTIPKPTY